MTNPGNRRAPNQRYALTDAGAALKGMWALGEALVTVAREFGLAVGQESGFLPSPVAVYLAGLPDCQPTPPPARRCTIAPNDQNPTKRRDAPVPEPEAVREPAAPALVMPRVSPDKGSVTANLATAGGAPDETPIGISDIREEGQTEGDGVEHESVEARDGTRIQQPFDPTRIKISTREPSVDLVMERIRRDEIDLAPDFQRSADIWSPRTQSRLIESILLRIPLPVFYMAADPDDNWQVVNGLQRLGTLRSFIIDKRLRLRGLEYFSQFEGCTTTISCHAPCSAGSRRPS